MKTAYFNYIGGIEVPEWMLDTIPQSGDVTNCIEEFKEDSFIREQLNTIEKESLIKELWEYGAWDDEELQDHEENLSRILWIAIGNLNDSMYENDI